MLILLVRRDRGAILLVYVCEIVNINSSFFKKAFGKKPQGIIENMMNVMNCFNETSHKKWKGLIVVGMVKRETNFWGDRNFTVS